MMITIKNQILELLEKYKHINIRLCELEHPRKPEDITERRYLEKESEKIYNHIKYLLTISN